MINYGAAPARPEIEVTLFGPGFGEASAVHIGEGAWILVDSCIDPDTREPASLSYLKRIGCDPAAVRVIVATHWHDDHVKGISALAEACPNADFVIPAVFNQKEALSFLAAFGGDASGGLSRGTRQLFKVIKSRPGVSYALHKSIVFQETVGTKPIFVTALAPLSTAFGRSLAFMASFLPTARSPNNDAPPPDINLESIVLHVDFGDDAVLLGADLEIHQMMGWDGIARDNFCKARRKSTAFKVAHHGSVNGHHADIWSDFLVKDAVAFLTPFNLGKVHLPMDEDRKRIRQNTKDSFITSNASRSADMDSRLLKRVKDIAPNVSKANPAFGAVRLRKQAPAPNWSVELFGAAGIL